MVSLVRYKRNDRFDSCNKDGRKVANMRMGKIDCNEREKRTEKYQPELIQVDPCHVENRYLLLQSTQVHVSAINNNPHWVFQPGMTLVLTYQFTVMFVSKLVIRGMHSFSDHANELLY